MLVVPIFPLSIVTVRESFTAKVVPLLAFFNETQIAAVEEPLAVPAKETEVLFAKDESTVDAAELRFAVLYVLAPVVESAAAAVTTIETSCRTTFEDSINPLVYGEIETVKVYVPATTFAAVVSSWNLNLPAA